RGGIITRGPTKPGRPKPLGATGVGITPGAAGTVTPGTAFGPNDWKRGSGTPCGATTPGPTTGLGAIDWLRGFPTPVGAAPLITPVWNRGSGMPVAAGPPGPVDCCRESGAIVAGAATPTAAGAGTPGTGVT